MLTKKKRAYTEYHQVKKDMQDYLIAKQNIDAILHENEKEEQKQKSKDEINQGR